MVCAAAGSVTFKFDGQEALVGRVPRTGDFVRVKAHEGHRLDTTYAPCVTVSELPCVREARVSDGQPLEHWHTSR